MARISLGVVVDRKGRVLLIKRVKEEIAKDGSTKLIWAFPGGKRKGREKSIDCLVREIKDETGYDAELVLKIGSRRHPQFDVFATYYLCLLLDENQEAGTSQPHEVVDIAWVKTDKVKEFITTDLDGRVEKVLVLIERIARRSFFDFFGMGSPKGSSP